MNRIRRGREESLPGIDTEPRVFRVAWFGKRVCPASTRSRVCFVLRGLRFAKISHRVGPRSPGDMSSVLDRPVLSDVSGGHATP